MEPYLAVPLLDAEESREGRVNSPKILGPLQQRENVRKRAAGSGDRPVTRWRVHRVPGLSQLHATGHTLRGRTVHPLRNKVPHGARTPWHSTRKNTTTKATQGFLSMPP